MVDAKLCSTAGCDEKRKKDFRFCKTCLRVMRDRMKSDGFLESEPDRTRPAHTWDGTPGDSNDSERGHESIDLGRYLRQAQRYDAKRGA